VSLMKDQQGTPLTYALSALFFAVSVFFVWRSFYGMSIGAQKIKAG